MVISNIIPQSYFDITRDQYTRKQINKIKFKKLHVNKFTKDLSFTKFF